MDRVGVFKSAKIRQDDMAAVENADSIEIRDGTTHDFVVREAIGAGK